MFEEWEIGYQLEGIAEDIGASVCKNELVYIMFNEMVLDDHDCAVTQSKHLVVDDQEFTFTRKSKKDSWSVKYFGESKIYC